MTRKPSLPYPWIGTVLYPHPKRAFVLERETWDEGSGNSWSTLGLNEDKEPNFHELGKKITGRNLTERKAEGKRQRKKPKRVGTFQKANKIHFFIQKPTSPHSYNTAFSTPALQFSCYIIRLTSKLQITSFTKNESYIDTAVEKPFLLDNLISCWIFVRILYRNHFWKWMKRLLNSV